MSDDRSVIVFDGECVLCARSIAFVAAHDADGHFAFTAAGSETARRLLKAHPLDPAAPGSLVLVDGQRVFTKSEGALRIARRLVRPWAWLAVLLAVPRPIRDGVYDVVARFRYRWFGRRDACALPAPEVRARLLP